jgi:arabinogalactan endo-1,4-beta-galactosidase
MTTSRRQLFKTSGVLAAAAAFGAVRPAPALAAGPAVRGADLSFLLQMEAAGVRYTDGGAATPVERILAANGANWSRQRVWVNPPSGYSNAASALATARRTKAAGLRLLLDPHYSDFWADPGHQATPAAWRNQDLATLTATVRTYTRDLVASFAAQGTPVDMIQIGNETVDGFLWPLGELYRSDGEHWNEYTTLVKACIAGAKAASSSVRIMLHIDRGGSNGDCRYFYDHVRSYGVAYDVIGLSYYPMWHGSLAALRSNLNDLGPRYGKDIVVVETAYPWTLTNGDSEGNLVSSTSQLPDAGTYPPTPAGQAAYLRAVQQILVGVPGGRGLGWFYWEPEWLPGVGWQPGAGNPNDNLTLFNRSGATLQGVDTFAGV